MAVKCNQTAHQKETVKLIKDFFESANYDIPNATNWGTGIISRLFGITGIKFDKPFMAEVLKGRFTTISLLKQYPINESQVMYIFVVSGKSKGCYDVKATRVTHDGKIYTDIDNYSKWYLDKYYKKGLIPTYYSTNEYNTHRKQAIKTLVLIADKENVIEVENRNTATNKECGILRTISMHYDDIDYRTQRVELIEKEGSTYWVTLKGGSGKKHEHKNYESFEPFDKSGYFTVAFRKFLANRLENYGTYIKLKRVVETDYLQELKTRHDEIIMLKNLIATNIINNTDYIKLSVLDYLMSIALSALYKHDDITSKLEESKKIYEKHRHKLLDFPTHRLNFYIRDCYSVADEVTKTLKDIDRSIMKLREDLLQDT